MSILPNNEGKTPQVFIATHSERILQSILNKKDSLIIRLFKESNNVKCEPIDQMGLCLPSATYAELDYIIFHIPSYEYHNQLFDYYSFLINKEKISDIDLELENVITKICSENFTQYYKERKHNNTTYKMLPTYVRNYYHHPIDTLAPSIQELELSIHIMQKLIKHISNNINN